MALPQHLEEAIKTLPADQQEAGRKLIESNEALRGGYLRQSDYDRMMNESKQKLSDIEKQLGDARNNSNKWDTWAKDNVPRQQDLLKKYDEQKVEIEALKKKSEAAAHNNGNPHYEEGDPDGIEALRKEVREGRMSPEDIDRRIVETATKIANEQAEKVAEATQNKFFTETYPATVQFTLDMNAAAQTYRQQFNEELDTQAFSKFMGEEGINNPQKGLARFTQSRRHETEIAAAKQAGIEEGERQAAAKMGVPGSGVTPAQELGPLQMRLRDQRPPDVPEGEVGSGALAAAAAESLRKDGKY